MSTSAKVAVNRANARRSTGPRTAAGRARSARNAVRHGLSMAVSSDPELYAAALALTQRLTEDGGPVELASVIAEATVEIWRVRRRRHEFILDAVERGGGTPPAQRLKQLTHFKRHINTLPIALVEKLLADLTEGHRNPDESVAEREVRVVAELAPELRRLERYERRALSRRKFAMRAFAAARGGRGPGDDVKPADKTR